MSTATDNDTEKAEQLEGPKVSRVRRQQRRDLVSLTIFVIVSAIFIYWLGAVMSASRPGSYQHYKAVFNDISGLAVGDQVRIAGADVGKVESIKVRPDSTVLVSFGVRPGNDLNSSTRATIQYKNLIGDRDLLLTRPNANAAALPAGSTIPVQNTQAALDLDTLLNGFQPLFQGLNPSQINALSGQLVAVMQGQGSAVRTLVSTVGSFTTAIGNREQLITSVIDNLNSVLGTVDSRRGTTGQLISQLDDLVSGLDRQDTQVLDASARIDGFAGRAADLLRNSRRSLNPDLRELGATARGLNSRASVLDALLAQLPKHYAKIQNTASYGNFFDFFLCGVRVTLSGSGSQTLQTPWIISDVSRCK